MALTTLEVAIATAVEGVVGRASRQLEFKMVIEKEQSWVVDY